MSNYYVYSYTAPGEDHPFYIGKGKGDRWLRHLSPYYLSRTSYFYNKLRKLLATGLSPVVKKLAENLSEPQSFELEKLLIQFYGRLDIGTGCLCNHTDGGEGLSGHKRSKEFCKQQSIRTLRENLSTSTLQKMSVAQQGKIHSKTARQKISDANRNYTPRLKSVESYDLNTGLTIKRYAGCRDTLQDGFRPNHVATCARGVRKSHGGLGWRRIEAGSE